MPDNLEILDGAGASKSLLTTEVSTNLHIPHHKVGDGTDTAEIQTGAVNGEKGLRVFIGPTDPVSDLPVFVDFAHHQVHEGEAYKAQAIITADTSFEIAVPTYSPTIRAPHMMIGVNPYDGAVKLEIYENPGSLTGAGATLAARNRNRNSTNVPASGMTITPGTITGGDLLETLFVGAGTRSANGRATEEWPLKSGETYRVVVTELTATSQTVVSFDWYEDLGV